MASSVSWKIAVKFSWGNKISALAFFHSLINQNYWKEVQALFLCYAIQIWNVYNTKLAHNYEKWDYQQKKKAVMLFIEIPFFSSSVAIKMSNF